MTLLIVDDHAMVRSGLARLFEGREIAEAVDAHSALEAVRTLDPELIVLDLNLPDGGGFDLVRRLLRRSPGAKILVLSMHAQAVYAVRALEAGAMGYVSKSAPSEEVLKAAAAIAKGRRYVEARIAQEVATGDAGGPLDKLTARDLQVLSMLADGRSLTEIATAAGVSYKTIANGCTDLKAKLGASSTADLIRIALDLRAGEGELT
jgi:DNA-binding NarL/FixJ family response regulator